MTNLSSSKVPGREDSALTAFRRWSIRGSMTFRFCAIDNVFWSLRSFKKLAIDITNPAHRVTESEASGKQQPQVNLKDQLTRMTKRQTAEVGVTGINRETKNNGESAMFPLARFWSLQISSKFQRAADVVYRNDNYAVHTGTGERIY